MAIRIPYEKLKKETIQAGQRDGKQGVPGIDEPNIPNYEQRLVDSYEATIRGVEGKFHDVEAQIGNAFKHAKKSYNDVLKQFEAKQTVLGRPVIIHIRLWVYFLLMATIIGAEVPVNKAVFDTFGDIAFFAYLLAVFLSFLLMVFAHLTGKSIKHHGFRFWHIGLAAVVAGILALLAYVRVVYFSNPEEGVLTNALKHMDPKALTTLFMLMNVLFFMVAVWLSYEAHDEDPHYQEIERIMLKRQRAARRFSEERERNLKRHKKDAEVYIENAQDLIRLYREENIASRDNKTTPQAFRDNKPEAMIHIDKYPFTLTDNEL